MLSIKIKNSKRDFFRTSTSGMLEITLENSGKR